MGRGRGLSTVFFAAHVNITALGQDKQRQTCKYSKTYRNFPHDQLQGFRLINIKEKVFANWKTFC